MIVLVRIDERLIHGQVVVGWGGKLRPTRYTVIDDDLAESEWEVELVLSGIPDGATGDVLRISEAAERWQRWESDDERRLLLVQSPRSIVSLMDAGAPISQVNFGGMHKRTGRQEHLPYIHLDENEAADCAALCERGVILRGQDVPTASATDLCARLRGK